LSADFIWLNVSDDGQGFDIKQKDLTVGHGLANMRTRAEELGGSFAVESVIEQGTSIRLRLPVSS
jgi:signal transduction histidine kinase